ncbi:hypothetical protein BpHYR1_022380 [Brachionus plicatilis]|uniref:Uncharacterized protein n=1 Tax=Brachionus plicatilis TaxID=10195 RepID=A0A3M7T3L2_BRAPC|nr:hypothetical protein BpHYR1_022380 [Brachionus plicatilis]
MNAELPFFRTKENLIESKAHIVFFFKSNFFLETIIEKEKDTVIDKTISIIILVMMMINVFILTNI